MIAPVETTDYTSVFGGARREFQSDFYSRWIYVTLTIQAPRAPNARGCLPPAIVLAIYGLEMGWFQPRDAIGVDRVPQ